MSTQAADPAAVESWLRSVHDEITEGLEGCQLRFLSRLISH